MKTFQNDVKKVYFFVCVLSLIFIAASNFSKSDPPCPEEDEPLELYEDPNPMLFVDTCLGQLGFNCDSCCIRFYYYKRAHNKNGEWKLDIQFAYAIPYKLGGTIDSAAPARCDTCFRYYEEDIIMDIYKKIILRHCHKPGSYDLRGGLSMGHHLLMRSGYTFEDYLQIDRVCALTGCCYRGTDLDINENGTEVSVNYYDTVYFEPYRSEQENICNNYSGCSLECGLIAGLNLFANRAREQAIYNNRNILNERKVQINFIGNYLSQTISINKFDFIEISINNVNGTEIIRQRLNNDRSEHYINVENLQTGVYFYVIKTNSPKTLFYKFIIIN